MNNLTINKNLLEEIQKTLLYKDNFDENIISLYELSLIIKKKHQNMKKMIIRNSKKAINNNCNNISLHISSVNFKTGELILILDFGNTYKIRCKKENGKIILTPFNNTPNFIISNFNIEELSTIYDNVMKYKEYVTEECYRVTSTNNNFLTNITKDGVSVYSKQESKNDFIISSYVFKDHFVLNTESSLINQILKNNEVLILKNTYIEIEKCPKWAQEKLYQLRQKTIIEQKATKVKKLKN